MKFFIRKRQETIIYLAIWLMMFVFPIANDYLRHMQAPHFHFSWNEIWLTWRMLLFYFAGFLIHNIFFAPLLIYKKKKIAYVVCVACLFAMFYTTHTLMRPNGRMPDPPHPELREMPAIGMDKPHRMHKPPRPMLGNMEVFHAFAFFMMLGMNLGVKLYIKTNNDHIDIEEREKRHLQYQLKYLKYQINPHFLMNTLNNIHALVDIDKNKAKTTIVELSKLMRYTLYESDKPMVSLRNELQFLENYIRLMKLRCTDKLKIKVDMPSVIPEQNVPPLIFISFVENAFKHGVSYQNPSFINIKIDLDGNRLCFECHNSKHPDTSNTYGGVGLDNVHKRLDLIYGDNYKLNINNGESEYHVELRIPFTTNKT